MFAHRSLITVLLAGLLGLPSSESRAEGPAAFSFLQGEAPESFDLRFNLEHPSPGVTTSVALEWRSPADHVLVQLGKNGVRIAKVLSNLRVPVGWSRPLDNGFARGRIVIKRRPYCIRVYIDSRLCAEGWEKSSGRGKIGFLSSHPGTKIAKVRCQPVSNIYFSDDFMRDEKSSPWETVAGTWAPRAVKNVSMSANAFSYEGKAPRETRLPLWDTSSGTRTPRRAEARP